MKQVIKNTMECRMGLIEQAGYRLEAPTIIAEKMELLYMASKKQMVNGTILMKKEYVRQVGQKKKVKNTMECRMEVYEWVGYHLVLHAIIVIVMLCL